MPNKRLDVVLICAGKYHDIDFARSELLKLLQDYPQVRTRVFEDYSDTEAIKACDFLISYTCEVIPSETELAALQTFVDDGGRWFALHGTNSILEFLENGRVRCPDKAPEFMSLLGSQFATHPPLCTFEVQVTNPDHSVTKGLEPFETFDELYVVETKADIDVLLHTRWGGSVRGFEQRDWPEADHPVLYERKHGSGAVLYLTLGHCRGHYDMQPLMDYYQDEERGSWENPIFFDLLRRGLTWASGDRLPYPAP